MGIGARWVAVVAVAIGVAGGGVSAGDRQTLASLAAALPAELAGLRAASGEDATYDRETIYCYLDGGAEVYLAYGMRACFARRYSGEAGEAILDLFEMPTAADAFGAFTLDRDGEPVPVGNDALLRDGWLSFWKGRFFVSVTTDLEAAAGREAALAVGRAVAAAISEPGEPPALIDALPQAGLEARSVRFVRHPVVLASHLYLPPGDPLSLAAGAEAALGHYRRAQGGATLVIVDYTTAESAAAALATATAALLPEADEHGAGRDEEGGWRAIGGRGRRVALVVTASTRAVALALVAESLPADRDQGAIDEQR